MLFRSEHGIDLLFMLRAVRRAMHATRIVQASSSLDGLAKDDRSPVTVADWASQAVVALELGPLLKAAPLVGEEEAAALRGWHATTLAPGARSPQVGLRCVYRGADGE